MVPPAGTHACWLASVLTRLDRPGSGRRVWEHNNLAQKNLAVVDVQPGDWLQLTILLDRLVPRRRQLVIELVRPRNRPGLEAALLHRDKRIFPDAAQPAVDVLSGNYDRSAVRFEPGPRSMATLLVPGSGQIALTLALRAPKDATRGRPSASSSSSTTRGSNASPAVSPSRCACDRRPLAEPADAPRPLARLNIKDYVDLAEHEDLGLSTEATQDTN